MAVLLPEAMDCLLLDRSIARSSDGGLRTAVPSLSEAVEDPLSGSGTGALDCCRRGGGS